MAVHLMNLDLHYRGIYAWDGDALRLCIDWSGGQRPKAFETRQGEDAVVYVLQRVKR